MDRDNEIELIQTIQAKDKRIKELETINENITRELLSRTEKLSEVLEKLKDSVPKEKIILKINELREKEEMYVHDDMLDYLDVYAHFNNFAILTLKSLIKEE